MFTGDGFQEQNPLCDQSINPKHGDHSPESTSILAAKEISLSIEGLFPLKVWCARDQRVEGWRVGS
jgi:hypothetical protein